VLTLTDSATTDQLWTFLISGGKITDAAPVTRTKQLGPCATIRCLVRRRREGVEHARHGGHHVNHLQRALGRGTPFEAIGPSDLEAYIRDDRPIREFEGEVKPVTIGKELATFHQIWEFAKGRGYIQGKTLHASSRNRGRARNALHGLGGNRAANQAWGLGSG